MTHIDTMKQALEALEAQQREGSAQIDLFAPPPAAPEPVPSPLAGRHSVLLLRQKGHTARGYQ